jgi:hypothetical protein
MRVILIALDSVGIDPLGHNRPESVYSKSRFLFPKDRGELLSLPNSPVPGVLVETSVASAEHRGAIECAITYTSIFSGRSAVDRHGLMQGLGLKEQALQDMIGADNLFRRFTSPCLVNAMFPFHFPFLGSSFVQDRLPVRERDDIERTLSFDGRPVRLLGKEKHGFAELFTLAEINQNIFVHAARQADIRLRTWKDVRERQALTGTMTNELEAAFNWGSLGETSPMVSTPPEAAAILVKLANGHDFTFYKYQLPDLVSHTGRVDLALAIFETIETFIETILRSIDPTETIVILTSDHGHLEQVAYSHGHPKGAVPTWYFGANAESVVSKLRRPEGIFDVIAAHGNAAEVDASVGTIK